MCFLKCIVLQISKMIRQKYKVNLTNNKNSVKKGFNTCSILFSLFEFVVLQISKKICRNWRYEHSEPDYVLPYPSRGGDSKSNSSLWHHFELERTPHLIRGLFHKRCGQSIAHRLVRLWNRPMFEWKLIPCIIDATSDIANCIFLYFLFSLFSPIFGYLHLLL